MNKTNHPISINSHPRQPQTKQHNSKRGGGGVGGGHKTNGNITQPQPNTKRRIRTAAQKTTPKEGCPYFRQQTEQFVLKYIQKDQTTNVITNDYILKYSATFALIHTK